MWSQLAGQVANIGFQLLSAARQSKKDPAEGNPIPQHSSADRGVLNKKASPLALRIGELFARNGYVWDPSVNLFGIRDTSKIQQDVWNDIIGVAVDGEVYVYTGTTDPSVYWSKNRNRRKHGWTDGAAHLCLGQYVGAYVVGTHRGYEAMAQWGGKVKVWRDVNEDFIQNGNDYVQEGFFGINIHKGHGKTIGLDSAGCQVILGDKPFAEFMGHIKGSKKYQANPTQSNKFNYTLFEKGQAGKLFTDLKKEITV